MKQKLKSKIGNLLFIGGIAELWLQFININENILFDFMTSLTIPFFTGAFFIVLFKSRILWIDRFSNRFPKTTIFLKWIGISPYLMIPLGFAIMAIGLEQAEQQIYGNLNQSPFNFFTAYGAFLQILEYVLYSLGLFAVLRKLYLEYHK